MQTQSIVNLNNHAVQSMCQGHYREAMVTLKSTLRQLMSEMNEREQDEVLDVKESIRGVFVHSSPVMQENATEKFHVRAQTSYYIYDRAMTLSGSESDVVLSEERTSATILYNIAFIHHMMGLMGQSQKDNFARALKMYEMASSVLSRIPRTSSDILLMLAILNNKGHVHALCMQINEAYSCLDDLRAVIEVCRKEDLVALNDDFVHFQMNVFLLFGSNQHAPAA